MGMQIGARVMEKSMEATQKTKNKTTKWSRNPTSVYISKGNKNSTSKTYLYCHVHCSTTAIICIKPVSINEWINEENVCVCECMCVCIMDYFSVIGKEESLPFVSTWLNLEDIKLSEVYVESKNVELIELESRIVVGRVWWNRADIGKKVQTFSYRMSKF